MQRDLLAAIDYSVSTRAHTFIGNAVSSFSGLLLMRRLELRRVRDQALSAANAPASGQHAITLESALAINVSGGPAAGMSLSAGQHEVLEGFAYTGGRNVIQWLLFYEDVHPLRSLKWVFAASATQSYGEEGAMRKSVLSALAHTLLKPVCIFSGAPSAFSAWLGSQGVHLVFLHRKGVAARQERTAEFKKGAGSKRKVGEWSPQNISRGTTLIQMKDIRERLNLLHLGFVDQYVLFNSNGFLFGSEITLDATVRPTFACFTPGTAGADGRLTFSDRSMSGTESAGQQQAMLIHIDCLQLQKSTGGTCTHAEGTEQMIS